MSKYIIDLRPDCKVVQQICVSDDNVGVGARSVELFDALTDDYVKENFKDLLEGEYQRGLDDAWEAARKLFSSMADSDIEKAFPIEWNNGGFNALMNLQPQYAIAKLKAYEEKQKADDKIEVGDEVEPFYTDITGVVTLIDDDTIYILWRDGSSTSAMKLKEVTKTGRHFDIQSILEDMRHD